MFSPSIKISGPAIAHQSRWFHISYLFLPIYLLMYLLCPCLSNDSSTYVVIVSTCFSPPLYLSAYLLAILLQYLFLSVCLSCTACLVLSIIPTWPDWSLVFYLCPVSHLPRMCLLVSHPWLPPPWSNRLVRHPRFGSSPTCLPLSLVTKESTGRVIDKG